MLPEALWVTCAPVLLWIEGLLYIGSSVPSASYTFLPTWKWVFQDLSLPSCLQLSVSVPFCLLLLLLFMYHWLSSNSERSAFLCLPGSGIKGVCHHNWLRSVLILIRKATKMFNSHYHNIWDSGLASLFHVLYFYKWLIIGSLFRMTLRDEDRALLLEYLRSAFKALSPMHSKMDWTTLI